MGTPQDPGAVFNMLWAGNNQLFSEIAAQFPDGAATAFTVGVGLAMLTGQCALSAYFSFIATSGPWHAMPGFTAHQLIYCERLTCPPAPTPHHTPLSAPHHTRLPPLWSCVVTLRYSSGCRSRVAVPVALYTAYIGCAGWFGSNASTPAERILGEDAMGLYLAQLQLAILLFWDIPTGLVVKALRDPVRRCPCPCHWPSPSPSASRTRHTRPPFAGDARPPR